MTDSSIMQRVPLVRMLPDESKGDWGAPMLVDRGDGQKLEEFYGKHSLNRVWTVSQCDFGRYSVQ